MNLRRLHVVVTTALVILCDASVGRAQGSTTATVLNLPGSSSGASIRSINASGEMVGWLYDSANLGHGFRISGGGFIRIDVPGASNTFPYAINASGQIAGQFYNGSGASRVGHGYLFSGGSFTTIDLPGSTSTAVTALNDSGQMAGYFYDSNNLSHGFLLSGDGFIMIDTPGSTYVTVTGMNASGQVVGYFEDSAFNTHGFLFSPGSLTRASSTTVIDFPGDVADTSLNAINALGQSVGQFRTNSNRTHGFLFSGGSFTRIDPPGASYTNVNAINNRCGQIVGLQDDGPGSGHGFLFSGGSFTTIGLPASYGTVRGSANAINDSGQIAGTFYSDAAHGFFGFLLDPDPSMATGDADEDGLCDDWEENGLTVYVDGTPVFLDLPAMGADPQHKDIFVQLDDIGGRLPQSVLDIAINAFAHSPVSNPDGFPGITLHVDNGATSIMNPKTGATWDVLSKAQDVYVTTSLGNLDAHGNFPWNTTFDSIKTTNLPAERAPVFHYAINEPVEILDADGNRAASGMSRGGYPTGASDFILAVTSIYSESEVGGTFMHELGHNLGLSHGGADDINHKPNYLSIMNYLFQLDGVPYTALLDTRYDYSHFGPDSDPSNFLPVLDENHLNETTGLGASAPALPIGANVLNYRTSRFCGSGLGQPIGPAVIIGYIDKPIDWDCDSPNPDTQTDVPADVNGDGELTLLSPYDDWAHLVYNGGRIGQFGGAILPPSTPNTEATPEELRQWADFWAVQKHQSVADTIAPATTAALSAPPNAAGWHNHDVMVMLSAIDNPGGSGVKQITYSASGAQLITGTNVNSDSAFFTVNTEGTTTISFFATDNAGNIETAHSFSIRLDKTPPTIIGVRSPNPNANDWNNSPVTITFQCSDGLSGLAAGSLTPPTVVATQGAGQSVKGTCTDLAGNVASLTMSAINIDTTPPSITLSPSTSTLWPPNSSMTPVLFSGAVTDATSGVDGSSIRFVVTDEYGIVQPSGNVTIAANGTYSFIVPLEASRLGSDLDGRLYTITVTAQDNAGNQASRPTTVMVPHDQGR